MPIEYEVLQQRLSAEAIGLLVLMRFQSATQELDGDMDAADLEAAALYCRLPKARLARMVDELTEARAILRRPAGRARDVNYAAWSKTRAERDEERADWRERKKRGRGGVSDGQIPLPVPEMSHRDIRGNPPGVTRDSRNTEAEAEAKTDAEAVEPGAPGLRPSAPVRDGGEFKSAGPNGESADVVAYARRFEEHGRTVDGADLAFLRRVPYQFDRLSRTVVLAAIDDVADRFTAQQQPMPAASYLAGRLAEVQAHAADSGIRPRTATRSPGGPARPADVLGDVLSSTGNTQAVNSQEE